MGDPQEDAMDPYRTLEDDILNEHTRLEEAEERLERLAEGLRRSESSDGDTGW